MNTQDTKLVSDTGVAAPELPLSVGELELKPVLSGGDLVAEHWWRTAEIKPVPAWKRHWLFIVTFVLPMLLAGIYLFLIASDQYVSEAQFIVRTSAHAELGSLASLMQGQKLSRATDESYAVAEYLTSRDVVTDLVRDDHLRDILSRPSADLFNRFPNMFSRNTDEELYRHFVRFVDIRTDSESGIDTLRVRAFTPADARDLAFALLKHGETLVNQLNERAYKDAVGFARRQLDASKAQLVEAEQKVTQYRNDQKVIDPNKEAAAALTNVSTLMSTLTELEVSLSQQIATTPTSPLIAPLRGKVQVLRDEIDKQRAEIAGANRSLVGSMAAYDSLMLDRDLAEKRLEAAALHLLTAEQDAGQQQLYIQTVVSPDQPDIARYPRRLLSLLMVGAISLCVFTILRSLMRVLWEHHA